MNENNQPQSQQTKRERGLYHVKRNGYWTVAEYTDHHGQWRVFNNTDQMQSRDFEEIDERRIERGDSPTEQPGDKEIIEAITRAQFGTREQSDHIERHMAEYFTRWHTYKDKFTHLEWYHIFLDFYDSLPILSEVSTLRSKQAELVE